MNNDIIQPVFFDAKNRRWKRFKILCLTILTGLALVFGILVFSTVVEPRLPTLVLTSSQHLPDLPPATPEQPSDAVSQSPGAAFSFGLSESHASERKAVRPEVIGFYVNWDDNSFTSLKQNISRLDKVVAEWLYLSGPDGIIGVNDPDKMQETVRHIREQRPDLAIVPLINNFNSKSMVWDSELIARTLRNPTSRNRLIVALRDFVLDNGFAGISIDFENIPPPTQPHLLTFMQELYGVFHPLGLEVSQSVPPNDPLFDLRALSQANDYVILMAYDEFAGNSNAGPVASRSWFDEHVQRALLELPAEKVVIGIGGYGYDWQHGKAGATTLSFQEVLKITKQYGAEIAMDPQALNPTFGYRDDRGTITASGTSMPSPHSISCAACFP